MNTTFESVSSNSSIFSTAATDFSSTLNIIAITTFEDSSNYSSSNYSSSNYSSSNYSSSNYSSSYYSSSNYSSSNYSIQHAVTEFSSTQKLPYDPLDPHGALDCSRKYVECEATRYFWMVMCPLLLVLGSTGNILTMIMMLQRPYKQSAFGAYLLCIAFTDTLGIWTGLTRYFIKNAFLYNIRNYSPGMCQTQMFFLYANINTSAWLLTGVTVERTISIYLPAKTAFTKNLKKTWFFIAIIFLIQYGWNFHVFFTRGKEVIKVANGTDIVKNCGYPTKAYKNYWYTYHNNIALVDYSLLPFFAMLIMNIAIFVKLKSRDRACRQMTSVKKTINVLVETTTSSLTKVTPKAPVSDPYTSKVSHKTLMLLPVSVFFLVATLIPLAYTGIQETLIPEDLTEHEDAIVELVDESVSWLLYLNHSVNFYLYCLTGKVFRKRCHQFLLRLCNCPLQKYKTMESNESLRSPALSRRKFSSEHSTKNRFKVSEDSKTTGQSQSSEGTVSTSL